MILPREMLKESHPAPFPLRLRPPASVFRSQPSSFSPSASVLRVQVSALKFQPFRLRPPLSAFPLTFPKPDFFHEWHECQYLKPIFSQEITEETEDGPTSTRP